MTEAEWLACTEPQHLFYALELEPVSSRKLRLFARACSRMTRGRGGWLGLPRTTLAFATPCRSPGALSARFVRPPPTWPCNPSTDPRWALRPSSPS
jgi:hypothetical protein